MREIYVKYLAHHMNYKMYNIIRLDPTIESIMNRRDVEQYMDNNPSIELNNMHYIFLRYLRDGIVVKDIGQYSDIIRYIGQYDKDEVIALFNGPLKIRYWLHAYYIYIAGFKENVLKHYTGYMRPTILGFDREYEVIYMMVRLHNIKYSDSYEYYYEIWYKIDPMHVQGHVIECTKRNIRMLKRLGLKSNVLKVPLDDVSKFSTGWAKYYLAQYILEGICPYDSVNWEDDIYSIMPLTPNVLVQYFRYFLKHNVPIYKKYDIEIHSVKSNVLDIIGHITQTSIIDHYVKYGELRDYIDWNTRMDEFILDKVPKTEELHRIIELKDCINIVILVIAYGTDDLHNMIILFKKHNIKIRQYYDPKLIPTLMLMDNGMIDLDSVKKLHIEDEYMDRLSKYPEGLISIWNKFPSIRLLYYILQYCPNILDKIIIPQDISQYYALE